MPCHILFLYRLFFVRDICSFIVYCQNKTSKLFKSLPGQNVLHNYYLRTTVYNKLNLYFLSDFSDVTRSDCGNPWAMVSSICQVIYLFLQLFMIFKFSNVIVNRSKRLARLAFMHCIASAICFWISAIINETMDNILKTAFDNVRDNFTSANAFSRGK